MSYISLAKSCLSSCLVHHILSFIIHLIVCCKSVCHIYLSVSVTRFHYHCFNFVIIIFDFVSLFIMSALNLIYVLMLFSVSDVSDAFYFNKVNIMLFLDCFKLLDKNYYINNSELIKKLSDYCKLKI